MSNPLFRENRLVSPPSPPLTATPPVLVSAVRWLWRYRHQAMRQRVVPLTAAEIAAVVATHPELQTAVGLAMRLRRRLPRGLAMMLIYECQQLDAPLAREFFATLASDRELTANDPIGALRRCLTQERVSRMLDCEQLKAGALTVIAWNLVRQDKTITRLGWKGALDITVPFPVIC